MSAAEWLSQAPEFVRPEQAEALRAQAAERLRAEREQVTRRARELDAELEQLGVVSGESAQPAPDWPIAKLVVHYVEHHPNALGTEVVAYVLSVRPGDKRQMEANVHSVLYKYTKPGGRLVKTGSRGAYRFSISPSGGR